MRRKAIIPALALSAMSIGGFMVAGPVSAQDEPADSVGGEDPNESGITETADQPEAPEADDLAPGADTEAADSEEAAEAADAEVADVEESEAADAEVADVEESEAADTEEVVPLPQIGLSSAEASDDPLVLAQVEDEDDDDDGDDEEQVGSGGGVGATPVGGAATGGGGMADYDGTSATPTLIAGGIGSALLASGVAARRRGLIGRRTR